MSNTIPTDIVFIKNLIVDMSAGIYDHEKQNKQRIIINVTLNVECNAQKKLSSIDDVTSYEDITNEILNITRTKHYDLLEELAEVIARTCTTKKYVHKVCVRIEKPDIISDVDTVGIEISRP
ncbi:MAG: hypothetical protein COA45_02390 [Zetaproteobacteria bacterium]|nr:MAG: hypothetical protein COA45_02390 [Zetaproteobacteria bacterium]